MYRITLSACLLAGDALAHPGHGAPAAHAHGWETVLLVVAVAVALAAVAWLRIRK